MYKNWPSEDQIRLSHNDNGVNGAMLSVDLEREPHSVPGKVEDLLMKFGWEHSQFCPNSKEQLFQKKPPTDAPDNIKAAWDNDLQTAHWYWYEAMSYEFGKFMSIGTDVDWSKEQHPSNVGGSTAQAPAGV